MNLPGDEDPPMREGESPPEPRAHPSASSRSKRLLSRLLGGVTGDGRARTMSPRETCSIDDSSALGRRPQPVLRAGSGTEPAAHSLRGRVRALSVRSNPGAPMSRSEHDAEFQVLLSPRATLIVDIFRALDRFDEHDGLYRLDDLEQRLCGLAGFESAQSLVSDALMLAVALRADQVGGLLMNPLESRRATPDEYRLYGLIVAAGDRDHALAVSCAHRLGLTSLVSTLAHAENLADSLSAAGLRLEPAVPAILDALRDSLEAHDEKFAFGDLLRSRS